MVKPLTPLQTDIIASLTALGGGGTVAEIQTVLVRNAPLVSITVLRQALKVLEERHDLVMQVTDRYLLRAAVKGKAADVRKETVRERAIASTRAHKELETLIGFATKMCGALLENPSAIDVDYGEALEDHTNAALVYVDEVATLNKSLVAFDALNAGMIEREDVIAPHSDTAREILSDHTAKP